MGYNQHCVSCVRQVENREPHSIDTTDFLWRLCSSTCMKALKTCTITERKETKVFDWYSLYNLEACSQCYFTQVLALCQDLSGYLEAPADIGVIGL